MFHSTDTAPWSWLVDQLAAELARSPSASRDEILQALDASAGYRLNPADGRLSQVASKRRELVDRLLERVARHDADPGRTLILNEKFAKSVTLA
ncbi:hypothetical protein ACFQPG_10680 [Sphingomonas sp. GCM10030256]|uniref:hypothetical protein n=1 Tax=Sphingomonas sp. GCM10030256 TaxID=3273427 RepID=UPI00361E01EF